MAEIGSEIEIKGVKEALGAGQQLLQKLYAELDKEREASATSASEALSMILRLQEEKAAMKLEANQYQRMAEEQICHAEEYLAGFEDVIHQKEMEVASLEFQVQAYRYKLLSLGCHDSLGPCEPRFADKLLVRPEGDVGESSKVRRAKSLPPSQFDELYLGKDGAEMEIFESPKPDSCWDNVEPTDRCSWEQNEMLDEQIKEISVSKGSGEDRFGSSNGGIDVCCSSSVQDKPSVSRKCSPMSSVQDIFEIPEVSSNLTLEAYRTQLQLQKKLIFEGEDRLGKPDSLPMEPFEMHHINDEPNRAKKAPSYKGQKNKAPKARKGKAISSGTTPARQQIDEIVAESEPFQQLCNIIEQLERNRSSSSTRQVTRGSGVGELLKEIQEQLNSIQSEMRCLKIDRHPAPDNLMFDLLQEAMLYFWF